MDNYTVYMHISPREKRYIGITGQDVKNGGEMAQDMKVRWCKGVTFKQ